MDVKTSLLKALVSADGEYISGGALAETLGVSRNAVWKAVKALESQGYCIESVQSKGYRLSENGNHLSAEIIKSRLNEETSANEIIVYDTVESTNDIAKKLASQGASDGTAVIADQQTAGRGRLGRAFISPTGTGIYMSVVIRPDFAVEYAPMITSASACAVAEAVEKLCGQDVNIKWVNDIYINGRKICGILTEASLGLEMKNLDYAVIGIGVNVRSVKNSFDDKLLETATSIEDETGVKADRNTLCAEILNRLAYYMKNVSNGVFLDEYRRREYLTGKQITANSGNEMIEGTAVGIDDNANLIVKLSDGEIRHLSSGEANLCRVKK